MVVVEDFINSTDNIKRLKTFYYMNNYHVDVT